MMSKTLRTATFAAALAAVAMTAAAPAQAKLKRITIGTNPAGTMYFVLGGGFAKLFQEKLGIRSTAQPHAGSSVYLPLLQRGEITLGLNSSLDSALAYNGRSPYKSATKKVRVLARVWLLPYAYFVRADSGMTKIGDLKGKRVVIHIKSNVSLRQLNTTILATAGLTFADVKAVEAGGIPQNINMVVEGRADAAITALRIPVFRKAHAGIPGGARILNLGPKATDQFMSNGTPGSRTFVTKPAKGNVGVPAVTKVAAFDSYVNVAANVSNEDAYRLIKTMHTSWKELQKPLRVLRGLKPNQIAPSDNVMPYHPGAVKYFKEAGIWTAENAAQNAKLLK